MLEVVAADAVREHLRNHGAHWIQLKEIHTKFPPPELGPWASGSKTVGSDWKPPVLEGWEKPAGH